MKSLKQYMNEAKKGDGDQTLTMYQLLKKLKAAGLNLSLAKMMEESVQILETKLNPNDPHKDYAAKTKVLSDLQMHPDTQKDPEMAKAVAQRKVDLDKEYETYKSTSEKN